MTTLLDQALPIFFLLALGWSLRVAGWIDDATGDALKLLVVRIVLPAVLFLSFVDLDLRRDYLALIVVVLAVCLVGLVLGRWLLRRAGIDRPYAPFLMTGYEYGMLGISLFAGAYGLAAIGTIAVIGLGHELFIWFVFFGLLIARQDRAPSIGDLALRFAKNPVTIAILAGLALNAAGLHTATLDGVPVAGALIKTLRFLAPLTVPLILIVVGHGLRSEPGDLGIVVRILGLRLALQIPAAFLVAFGLLGWGLGVEPRFQVALFTLMILPPPFIVPLFIPKGEAMAEERRIVHQVLSLHTLLSLVLFTGLLIAVPRL